MARKQSRRIRVTNATPVIQGGTLAVALNALGMDGPDADRPFVGVLNPADARLLAAQLVRHADYAEKHSKP